MVAESAATPLIFTNLRELLSTWYRRGSFDTKLEAPKHPLPLLFEQECPNYRSSAFGLDLR